MSLLSNAACYWQCFKIGTLGLYRYDSSYKKEIGGDGEARLETRMHSKR